VALANHGKFEHLGRYDGTVNFGKIDHFLLFGGGKLFADMALRLKRSGRSIHAVTSQRHLHEGLIDPPIPLGNFLEDNEIDFLVSSDVNNDRSVSEMITPPGYSGPNSSSALLVGLSTRTERGCRRTAVEVDSRGES
jgi:hypothetical protein